MIIIEILCAFLIALLIFQYLISLFVGMDYVKSKREFWREMIPYKPYVFIIKTLIVSSYNNIKNFYNHYKKLPE